jgi:membrane carboxypeptidase/penicillin-binding protein
VGLSGRGSPQILEETYTTRVAQGGLKVYTTINVEAQKLATKAIREGLRRYEKPAGVRIIKTSARRSCSRYRRKEITAS